MRIRTLIHLLVLGCSAGAMAQGSQPTGPSLPLPPAPFQGVIAPSYRDSTPDMPRRQRAPQGAPNILVVLTDDVGFGASSSFGGPIPTPNLDRLAARGLTYNRFHTTAMCSPTRAALLTGRNHHAVANGTVANLSTGYPGYTNIIPRSAATVAEILRNYGYNTAMIGKHHNAPEADVSPQGPFDMWPTGLGFEYFYGFMAAETNQYYPSLYRGTQRVEVPVNRIHENGGILEQALTDDAIAYVHRQKSVDPDKPFLLYYASGATHAPLHVPAEWVARFRGQFDQGWDAVRDATVARQRATGQLPRSADVTPRPDGLPDWASLSADQQRVAARWMETYAAMLAYQDFQFGRLVNELDRMGQLDNTLIIFIEGDNGGAMEGGLIGRANPMGAYANGVNETPEVQLAHLDEIGSALSGGTYANSWAWAMNAPNPYAKVYASHLGGVRNGMVVSWPNHISARGIRSQFTHVNDILPTILDVLHIDAPASVNGVAQQPIDGVSFAYSFAAPRAAEQHRTQYFEMLGNQAIYHDGWWAATTPVRLAWRNATESGTDPTQYQWELYNLTADPAQAHNLAAEQPEKLAEMRALFDQQARANMVYPLDDRLTLDRFAASMPRARDRYVYWSAGITLPVASAPPLVGRSFMINADLDLPNAETSGTIVAVGGAFAGWSFHMVDGVPGVTMVSSQLPGGQSHVTATRALPAGKVQVQFEFVYDGGQNAGGEIIIRANGSEIGRGRIARTLSRLVEVSDTFDIGLDADKPVLAGAASTPFGGTIARVEVLPAAVGQRREGMNPPQNSPRAPTGS